MNRVSSKYGAKNERFTAGDPSSGEQATIISAEWLNGVQEEICGAIESRGLRLSERQDQLALALKDVGLRGENLDPFAIKVGPKEQENSFKIPKLRFDSTSVKAALFLIYVQIKTGLAVFNEINEAAAIYTFDKSKQKMVWNISSNSILETPGIISLSIDDEGQVYYKHRQVDPAGFDLELRISQIRIV